MVTVFFISQYPVFFHTIVTTSPFDMLTFPVKSFLSIVGMNPFVFSGAVIMNDGANLLSVISSQDFAFIQLSPSIKKILLYFPLYGWERYIFKSSLRE